jgi:hypothetical protein
MIKYGTSYLPCYNGDTEDWLTRFIDPRDVWPVDLTTRNHSLHHLGVPSPPPMPPPRVAVLHWPTCAQAFGFVHFVATDDQIEAYRTLKTNTGDYLELTDGLGGTPVKPFMYLLPPRPLSYIEGHKRMWLCTFVDARYFWWFGDREVNIDYPDPCEDVASTTTWADLFDAIADNLNIALVVDSVHAFYGKPSNRFEVKNQPMPVLLDAAARAVGMRFCASIDGTYRVWSASQANATDNGSQVIALESRRVAGYTLDNQAAFIPTGYTTSFGRVTCGSGCKVYDAEPYQVTIDMDEVIDDLYTPYTGYETNLFPGEFHYVGDMDAIIASGGITNTGDLEDYATKSAVDWWNWQVLGSDRVYAGTAFYPLNPAVEVAEWYYRRDKCLTRVTKHRTNDRALGMYRMSSDPGYLSAYRSSLDACNLGSGGSIPPTPGTTNCLSCAWLLDWPVGASRCLRFTITSTVGVCTCLDSQQSFDLYYDADGNRWIGGMLEGCCGCSALEFTLVDDADKPETFGRLRMMKRNKECDTSDQTEYNLKNPRCCESGTIDFDGANTRGEEDNCNGTLADCDNSFTARLECVACPEIVCCCPGCSSECVGCLCQPPAPPAWLLDLSSAGFTGAGVLLNIPWVLTVPDEADGCEWGAECMETTTDISLTFIGDGTTGWRLQLDVTGGSATYETVDSAEGVDCFAGFTLDKISSGIGGPATLSITPLGYEGDQPNDCAPDPSTRSFSCILTANSFCSCLNGVSLTLSWNAMTSSYDGAIGTDPCACTDHGSPLGTFTASMPSDCSVLDIACGECALGLLFIEIVEICPLTISYGLNFTQHIGNCCAAGGPGTLKEVTATVTEI